MRGCDGGGQPLWGEAKRRANSVWDGTGGRRSGRASRGEDAIKHVLSELTGITNAPGSGKEKVNSFKARNMSGDPKGLVSAGLHPRRASGVSGKQKVMVRGRAS